MRITNISPEYTYINVNGTLSMLEKKSFLGSKLINFADSISILNKNIIYYENNNNEQLNLSTEQLLPPIIYNSINDKQIQSSLISNNSQPNTQYNNNTSWILTININTLLVNYLFATLKSYRTFEGVQNIMTSANSVDSSITEYINDNLLSRYQFATFSLYVSYNNLLNGGLRFQNVFDSTIENNSNLINNFTTNLNSAGSIITITFNQSQPSTSYSFNYYYDLYFTKI